MKKPVLIHKICAVGILLLMLAGVVALSCSKNSSTPTPAQASPQASLTRVDGGEGSVTVQATWVNSAHLKDLPQDALKGYPQDQYVLIHVALDTHSVDLSKYDLSSLAYLSDGAASPVSAVGWVSLSDTGHHRSGVIAFSGMSNQDWASKYQAARLVVKGVAGVPERVFAWDF